MKKSYRYWLFFAMIMSYAYVQMVSCLTWVVAENCIWRCSSHEQKKRINFSAVSAIFSEIFEVWYSYHQHVNFIRKKKVNILKYPGNFFLFFFPCRNSYCVRGYFASVKCCVETLWDTDTWVHVWVLKMRLKENIIQRDYQVYLPKHGVNEYSAVNLSSTSMC